MYRTFQALVLRWLKLPPEPEPPDGDPTSLRVFRAGRRYLTLRLLRWGAAQAVVGSPGTELEFAL